MKKNVRIDFMFIQIVKRFHGNRFWVYLDKFFVRIDFESIPLEKAFIAIDFLYTRGKYVVGHANL